MVTSVPLTANSNVQAGLSRYCGRFFNAASATANGISVCCESPLIVVGSNPGKESFLINLT